MMKRQDKQWLRQGENHHIGRMKLAALIGMTLFLLLIGTCFLQMSLSALHPGAAKARGVLMSSQADGIQSATPASVSIVNVYFSRATGGTFDGIFPVKRTEQVLSHVVSVAGAANFAMQQLIAGPSVAEVQAGYTSLLHQALYGRSTCNGQQNFILAINKKGALPALGTATITLCRLIYSAGIGMDAGIRAEIASTLKQFAAIKNVVILLNNGHCFGDESGVDFCLR